MLSGKKYKKIKFINSFIIIIILIIMIGTDVYSQENKKYKVCLYYGPGGELAPDVEYALQELEISYFKLDDEAIKEGELKNCYILIIPGGYTLRLVRGLGKKGLEVIRKFVYNGGGYIGICAGAYLAAERVEILMKPPGLGIIDIKNKRRRGIGTKKIFLKDHPITKGIGKELTIRYQNGPDIIIRGEAEEVAYYKNGTTAIATASYGIGKVIIFSPHPEGSITQGVKPTTETLQLFKNAIEFCQ
ncbi:MAG: hypothetical protein IBV53_04230 [Candidatus Atribacteria bacterium]